MFTAAMGPEFGGFTVQPAEPVATTLVAGVQHGTCACDGVAAAIVAAPVANTESATSFNNDVMMVHFLAEMMTRLSHRVSDDSEADFKPLSQDAVQYGSSGTLTSAA
jgi:hypothetical protein